METINMDADFDADSENPALKEYIEKRLQQELAKYNLIKKTESLDLKQDLQTLTATKYTQHSASDIVIAELLTNLKDLQAFKDIISEALHEISHHDHNAKSGNTDNMTRHLAGLERSSNQEHLEQDVFSMMMTTSWKSQVWVYGFLAFSIQITLGTLVITDHMKNNFAATDMNIPIRGSIPLGIAKALVILLSILTQRDCLMSLKNILSYGDGDRWKSLHHDLNSNGNTDHIENTPWWIYVLIPNLLKGVQGLLIIVASFVLIVQSDDIVDLLKDYSVVFVISSVNKVFFDVADMGHVGSMLSTGADKVKYNILAKGENYKNLQKNIRKYSMIFRGVLFAIFISAWGYIAVEQINGKYVQQAYPICPSVSSSIGDGICQFSQGVGTNIIQCGWDGGDCELINEKYPDCDVDDVSLLGDGTCNHGTYNSRACGFDIGDCMEFNQQNQNKFPNCFVENIGWIGDGICNGFEYASEECERDGDDCRNSCDVEDFDRIGDGFCDEGEYNVDGCSFDGNDCVPSIKLIGDKYVGRSKWNGGVLGHDGNIYSIPYSMNKILKIEPSSNGTALTSLVGDSLGEDFGKWLGGVVGDNGIIYGIPFHAKSILSFNVTSGETALIAEGHTLLKSDSKFSGGVLAKNGMIYFIPCRHNRVVKFDPANSTHPLTEIGDVLRNNYYNLNGGVLGSDGNIYSIHFRSPDIQRVMKIDVVNDSTSIIANISSYRWDTWSKPTLARDGNIYAFPGHEYAKMLQINVENQTASFVGAAVGGLTYHEDRETWSDDNFWSGFVEGVDGFLYGIPSFSDKIFRFDPISHTATFLPLEEGMQDFVSFSLWFGGVRADNGFIYGIPEYGDQVLSIAPLNFRT